MPRTMAWASVVADSVDQFTLPHARVAGHAQATRTASEIFHRPFLVGTRRAAALANSGTSLAGRSVGDARCFLLGGTVASQGLVELGVLQRGVTR
jgi:hypothetical protein